MLHKTTVALLITTYNWPEALDLVLLSVTKQTVMPNEIVIADDGSDERTKNIINKYADALNVRIKHIWHPDQGFRKTIILNKAVREIESDYIVQVDGDIILHSKFIQDHLNAIKVSYFVKGSRSVLSEEKTKQVFRERKIKFFPLFEKGVGSSINGTRIKLLNRLFKGNPDASRNTKGCNFAFWKSDFVSINGYNNDLLGWGHEDIEIAARLVNKGVKRQQLKMVAVCYHLYHNSSNENTSLTKNDNLEVYNYTVKNKVQTCPNGYLETK